MRRFGSARTGQTAQKRARQTSFPSTFAYASRMTCNDPRVTTSFAPVALHAFAGYKPVTYSMDEPSIDIRLRLAYDVQRPRVATSLAPVASHAAQHAVKPSGMRSVDKLSSDIRLRLAYDVQRASPRCHELRARRLPRRPARREALRRAFARRAFHRHSPTPLV